MEKKTLIQIILIILIFVLTISFFNTYLKKDKIVKIENIENQKKSDVINDLKYFSKDNQGNTYLIEAESGISDNQQEELINLENVKAKITFEKDKEIIINAEKAVYNTVNFDTNFTKNVKLEYDYHFLTCKNIHLKFSENYAKLFGDVIYTNKLTKLYADKIEVDLINKTSKISMNDQNKKVTLKYLNNGVN